MRFLALCLLIFLGFLNAAQAEEITWPELKSGEIRILNGPAAMPARLLAAAALVDEKSQAVSSTYFKAPMGRDYVVVSPCCGVGASHAALFEFVGGEVRQVGLPVGDPRLGFTTQVLPDEITVDPDAKSIRAHVGTPTCEDGEWRYFYSFDAADRLYMRSAIDTSCEHLGIRELYHARQVDVGKWWNR